MSRRRLRCFDKMGAMKDREKRKLHSVWWGVLAVCMLGLGYRVFNVWQGQRSFYQPRDMDWPRTSVPTPVHEPHAVFAQGRIPGSWEVFEVEGISTNAIICAGIPLIDERVGAEEWCNILSRRTNPGDELKKGEQKTFYETIQAAIQGLGRRLDGRRKP